MRPFLPLCLLAMLPALQGCALQPLYAGGAQAGVAQGLGSISVSPIQGKAGWLMHNALVDQLGTAPEGTTPRYRLEVRLDDQLLGLGLLSNNTVGRERRILRARYQLIDAASGAILLDATAGSDAGMDVVSSEYATVAAEQTALENLTRVVAGRIVTNLAVKLRARQ
ncbi:LPS assembly lipoprotein LptE [Novosphingobium sediminicola]|nr:LPS assembly lipoprotein LptE [Novosphingobium sediminicola]